MLYKYPKRPHIIFQMLLTIAFSQNWAANSSILYCDKHFIRERLA